MKKKVTITYCKPCGYLRRAAAVADAIEAEFGYEPRLVPGGGGIFEVQVDDTVVARRTRGHFPEATEIVAAIRNTVRVPSHRRAAGK
ncbi:Rdx family protein [Ferrovibrio sp.]|uniref:Rdx family protein n=1 Tax=Ferrovibrio sp. TaxID=1917215 RepID=UPI002616B7A2|nr:Rdx family protein [Ferrovibrio sp.]